MHFPSSLAYLLTDKLSIAMKAANWNYSSLGIQIKRKKEAEIAAVCMFVVRNGNQVKRIWSVAIHITVVVFSACKWSIINDGLFVCFYFSCFDLYVEMNVSYISYIK